MGLEGKAERHGIIQTHSEFLIQSSSHSELKDSSRLISSLKLFLQGTRKKEEVSYASSSSFCFPAAKTF